MGLITWLKSRPALPKPTPDAKRDDKTAGNALVRLVEPPLPQKPTGEPSKLKIGHFECPWCEDYITNEAEVFKAHLCEAHGCGPRTRKTGESA